MAKPKLEEIRSYKEELVGAGGYYSNLRTEQRKDQEYYDDAFATSIKQPYHVIRTGTAKRICDAVTWHINTSNPQAIREPRKAGRAEEEKAAKVTKLLNNWLFVLIDEIQEAAKKSNKRGELFFQIEYNPKFDALGLPIILTSPDPMIIYPDPSEYRGVPSKVVKSCRMTVSQIERMCQNEKAFVPFNNPKGRKPTDTEGVDYWAWWNNEWRYIEADGQPLLKGEFQPNLLGKPPFAHGYSSYGEKSPEGKPETRAVGLLRSLRGRLREECEVESRLDSIIGLMANPFLVGRSTQEGVEKPEGFDELDLSPGHSVWFPFGVEYSIEGMNPALIQPLLYHLAEIKQSLGVELPPIAMGLPSTSRATGRQEDIYGEQYRKRFDKLIDNIERSLATALGMGLQYLYTIPGALPITIRATELVDGKQIRKEETITKEDIDGYYECQVRLKASDVIESDKQFMMYRMLMNEGHIDWETYLTEGLGWTQDKAKQVITDTLVEQMWKTNPQFAEIVMMDALQDAGRTDLLRKSEEQAALRNQMMSAQAMSPEQAQPRPSEAENPLDYQSIRQRMNERPYGIRQSGAGYTQG